MCGRYFLDLDFEQILKLYDFIEDQGMVEYQTGEIYPSHSVVVVQQSKLSVMRWGMKYDFMKRELINGRSETVEEKRLFREAFQKRRVIIPASAYYEWEKIDGKKIKREIKLEKQTPISMAGIYNSIRIGEEMVDSVVILTQTAAPELEHIHNRMPLFIPKELEEEWLRTDQPQLLLKEIEAAGSFNYAVE
jgi:putative SOS response-associated peptidase YedK